MRPNLQGGKAQLAVKLRFARGEATVHHPGRRRYPGLVSEHRRETRTLALHGALRGSLKWGLRTEKGTEKEKGRGSVLRASTEAEIARCVYPALGSSMRDAEELELELIQSQMAQKPMLRGEVGARALRVRSVSREEVWASAGVQGAFGAVGCIFLREAECRIVEKKSEFAFGGCQFSSWYRNGYTAGLSPGGFGVEPQ
jgi:hypothetical protein